MKDFKLGPGLTNDQIERGFVSLVSRNKYFKHSLIEAYDRLRNGENPIDVRDWFRDNIYDNPNIYNGLSYWGRKITGRDDLCPGYEIKNRAEEKIKEQDQPPMQAPRDNWFGHGGRHEKWD